MRSPTSTPRRARRLSAAFAAAALALSLSACAESAASTTDEAGSLTVGSTTSLAGVGVRSTISSGLFTDQGLTVEAVSIKSGNDAVPQLISGDLQVAQVDTTTALQAMEKGLPIKIIAAAGVQSTDGGAGVPSTGSILVRPDSDIQTAADLTGRKLGIHAINSQIWMNIRAVVDADGGDSGQVQFIEVPGPQAVDMLLKGEVEATTASEPLASATVAAGTARLVHSTDVPGRMGEPSSVYVATSEYIAENTETVKAFVEAVLAGQAAVNEDKDLGRTVAVEQLDYTEDKLAQAFILDYGTEAIDPEALRAVAEAAVEYGILQSVPEPSEVLADL